MENKVAAATGAGNAAPGTGPTVQTITRNSGTGTAALVVGIIGAVLALAALILAALAYARSRRTPSGTPDS